MPQSGAEMCVRNESKAKGSLMPQQEEGRAQEREEITKRIANFKATQQKFQREREEYFLATMQNAREAERPFWS
jgi:hypothetical protein